MGIPLGINVYLSMTYQFVKMQINLCCKKLKIYSGANVHDLQGGGGGGTVRKPLDHFSIHHKVFVSII